MISHDPPLDALSPLERLERRETEEMLRSTIETLSKKLSDVATLRVFGECNYEEISKMLNLPVGTVKSRLFHARMVMRHKMSGV